MSARRSRRRLVEEFDVSRRELRQRCLALSVARVVVGVILAVIASRWPQVWTCPGAELARVGVPIRLTIAVYVLAAITLLVIVMRSPTPKAVGQASLAVDLLAVSAFVAFSGGTESQLVLLYMFVIVGASTLLSPISGMTSAIASVCSLSLIYFGQRIGLLPGCPELIEGQGSAFRFVAVLSFLVLTGFLAGFLAVSGSRLKLMNVEILESLNAGVVIIDMDGTVQYLNAMGSSLLGVRAEEVRGKPVDRLLTGGAGEAILGTLRTRVPVSRIEVSLPTPRGTVPAGITTSVLTDRRRSMWGVAATFVDLTEAKRIEERLRHADRMTTIALSAAGMGHELRNPLACIRGGVDLLAEVVPQTGELAEVMGLITRETQRLSTIVESFLDMSRVSSPVKGRHMFREVWREVEQVLGLKFGDVLRSSVRLEVTPGSLDVWTHVDVGQMRQALLNLVQNAIEALAHGGRIEVSCRTAPSDGSEGSRAGVEIVVSDDGPGIPRGAEERIFEPFYTSKARGTGLGLATAKRIVEAHGGEIRLASSGPGGTAFRIWLPDASGPEPGIGGTLWNSTSILTSDDS